MLQRVGDVADAIGIGIEGGTGALAHAVVGVVLEIGPEHDVRHRVGRPLQSQAGIPAVASRHVSVQGVAEGGSRAAHEVLGGTSYGSVAVAVVPTDATVQFQLVFLLVVQVDARHLGGGQSLATAAPTASAHAEAHIVDIVGAGHEEYLCVVLHPSTEDAAAVTVLGTLCQVGIEHQTLVHALLDAEVEYGLFLTVINTADASQIALLVVSPHAFYNRCRQVLHGRLRIARHELLAIDHNLLDLLAVDGNLAVIVHLGTRQTLDQFLYHRALRRTIGRGIVDKGVGLQRHLGRLTSHSGALEHDGIGLHGDGAQRHILVAADA